MIDIKGPLPAVEVGTCNACDKQIGPNGTIPGARVFLVELSKNGRGGLAFRVCERCAVELTLGFEGRLFPPRAASRRLAGGTAEGGGGVA